MGSNGFDNGFADFVFGAVLLEQKDLVASLGNSSLYEGWGRRLGGFVAKTGGFGFDPRFMVGGGGGTDFAEAWRRDED
jgi:hypothetical protein